jgi:hypothetical protein
MDPIGSPDDGDAGGLVVSALRAMAVASTRRAQYESVQARLAAEMEQSEYLHQDGIVLSDEVRRTVTSVARGERAAGHSAVQMIHLLHKIVDEAALDRPTRRAVEPDVVEWGIHAYYAA